jgi:predicted Fe-Mo cluster-binding NifX family protein
MEFIVAITSQNKKTVFNHAGKCQNFLVYHIVNNTLKEKKVLELTKEETLHNYFHNSDNVVKNPLTGINMLLTGGIGEGAIQKLRNDGIQTHLIDEKDPDLVIEKLLNGTLAARKTSNCNCSCGGGKHNHSHAHQHKH